MTSRASAGTARHFERGGYAYVPGVFQYSAGVAALPGRRIERIRFSAVKPLEEGFSSIASALAARGLDRSALCACELRSPGQFSEDDFSDFNRRYVETLRAWGCLDGEINPVARSNVCPDVGGPGSPGFHAFCFAVPAAVEATSFVVAGSAECPEGRGNYRDHIVRRGETDPAAMREKVRFVMAEMARRMAALGFGWPDVTATQMYTVHDVFPFLADEILGKGPGGDGVTLHYARPPVVGLEFEMDCRRVDLERVI